MPESQTGDGEAKGAAHPPSERGSSPRTSTMVALSQQPAPKGIDLRLGDWRETMSDVVVDTLITDPPYGERTHAANTVESLNGVGMVRASGAVDPPRYRRALVYDSFTAEDVVEFVSSWKDRVGGWWCIFSCSDLAHVWRGALEEIGLFAFAPIACVASGGTVRLAGDGPANWTVYLNVARPRHAPYSKWGSLPGAYIMRGRDPDPMCRIGGKRIDLMRAVVRDYTKQGDLVGDPFAGHGTTLLACEALGRRAVGSEIEPEAHAIGLERIARGNQLGLL